MQVELEVRRKALRYADGGTRTALPWATMGNTFRCWVCCLLLGIGGCAEVAAPADVTYAEIPDFPDTWHEGDAADATTAGPGHEPLKMACMVDLALPGLGLQGMGMDDAGNVYLSGAVAGTVDFDPGPGQHLETSTQPRFFVARLRRDCSFDWVRLLDASVAPTAYISFAVDGQGNSYLLSQFSTPEKQAVNFDPGSGYDLHAAKGGSDLFVVAFGPDGAYRYSRTFGGDGLDRPTDIAVDGAGHVYVAGIYQGAVDFDWGKGTAVLHAPGPNDDAYFLLQIGGDGAFHWAAHVPSPLVRLEPHQPGGILATGMAVPGLDVDYTLGLDLAPFVGQAFDFVAAVRADGTFDRAWFSMLGTGGGFADMTFAADGTQYTTGPFWGSFDFDDGPGHDILKSVSYGAIPGDLPATDLFLRAVHADGAYGWTHQVATAIGNSYSTASPHNVRVAGDAVLVSGRYGGLIQDGTTFRNSSSDGGDVFVFSASRKDGRVDWGAGLGSSGSATAFLSPVYMQVAKDGRVALAGKFEGTADLDLSAGVHAVNGTGTFLVTFDATGCATGTSRPCACPGGQVGQQTCDASGAWATCGFCKTEIVPGAPCPTTCNVPVESCGKIDACSVFLDCGQCPASLQCPEVGCALPAPVVVADHLNHPRGLAVDGSDVYVLSAGSWYLTAEDMPDDATVMRLPRSGQPAVTLAKGKGLRSLAMDDLAVYWFDGGAHAVRKYVKATGKVEDLVADVHVLDLAVDDLGLVFLGHPLGDKYAKVTLADKVTGAVGPARDVPYSAGARVLADAAGVFVVNPEPVAGNPDGTVYQMGRQGGAYAVLAQAVAPGDVALDAQYVYYAPRLPGYALMRVPRNGYPQEELTATVGVPWGALAVRGKMVYGAQYGQATQSTWEGQVLAWDAKGAKPFVYARRLNHPSALAVDAAGTVFATELGATSTTTDTGRVLRLN